MRAALPQLTHIPEKGKGGGRTRRLLLLCSLPLIMEDCQGTVGCGWGRKEAGANCSSGAGSLEVAWKEEQRIWKRLLRVLESKRRFRMVLFWVTDEKQKLQSFCEQLNYIYSPPKNFHLSKLRRSYEPYPIPANFLPLLVILGTLANVLLEQPGTTN